VQFDLFVGDNVVQVMLANRVEDGFVVKIRGAKAGTRLEMVGKAARGGVVAEGAGDVGATVDFCNLCSSCCSELGPPCIDLLLRNWP
jgi:hypothetical protein